MIRSFKSISWFLMLTNLMFSSRKKSVCAFVFLLFVFCQDIYEILTYKLIFFQDNPHCLLIVTPKGGHLGWVAGDQAPFGCPWTDPVVMEFLERIQENKTEHGSIHRSEGAHFRKASSEIMV